MAKTKKPKSAEESNEDLETNISDETKQPEEISTEKDGELQYIFGSQLRKVRKNFFGNESQQKLGSKIFDKYPQNTMFQLEAGKGSVIKILKLLRFYHENGVNLNFLFNENADETQMLNFNLNANDTLFAQSVIDKYENGIRNLLRAKDHIELVLDKNILDFQKHIASIQTVTTVESIDLNKNNNKET
ncbi:hypothetical protein AAKU52_002620 [Pedobacter sp. CG_S7]|uniref:hypothetical protein n=1 Tax=Pedobacter sp. CG_S7 TaxID=3143930 RepID=UPI003392537D